MRPPVDYVTRSDRVSTDRTDEVLGWVIAAVAGLVIGSLSVYLYMA